MNGASATGVVTGVPVTATGVVTAAAVSATATGVASSVGPSSARGVVDSSPSSSNSRRSPVASRRSPPAAPRRRPLAAAATSPAAIAELDGPSRSERPGEGTDPIGRASPTGRASLALASLGPPDAVLHSPLPSATARPRTRVGPPHLGPAVADADRPLRGGHGAGGADPGARFPGREHPTAGRGAHLHQHLLADSAADGGAGTAGGLPPTVLPASASGSSSSRCWPPACARSRRPSSSASCSRATRRPSGARASSVCSSRRARCCRTSTSR